MVIDCDDSSDETNCSAGDRFYCENNDPLFVTIGKASKFKEKRAFLSVLLYPLCDGGAAMVL